MSKSYTYAGWNFSKNSAIWLMAIWREKLDWWYTIYFYIYDLNIATVNFCIVDIMEGKNAAKIRDYIQKQLDKKSGNAAESPLLW